MSRSEDGETAEEQENLANELSAAECSAELEWRSVAPTTGELNVGVIGSTGVGKSSLINTLRRVRPKDPGAAPTGVTQTTMSPTSYEYSRNLCIKLWDVPGVGSSEFLQEDYLKRIDFDKYDFFVLMCSARFTESTLWLAHKISQAAKRFIFVRSKVDIDVRNDSEDDPNAHNEEELLRRLKDDCIAELSKAGFTEATAFLVCKNELLYDFPALEKKLTTDLPQLQQEAAQRTMHRAYMAKIVRVGAESTEEAPREAEDFTNYIKREGLGAKEIMKELQRRLDEWKHVPLNVALIGNSGVGKSTLINTLRRIKPLDPRAAKTGVTQTTTTPTPYEHSDYPNVQFWDLPGVGTTDFPKATYLKQVNSDAYDFFIVVVAVRLLENDVWLAKEIQRSGKRFYFVRSKIDSDVQSDKDDYPNTHDEQRLLTKMRDACIDELEKAGISNPLVFLVCKNPDLYDFGKLEMKIISDLPDLKSEVMLYVRRNNSRESIKLVTKKLIKRSWLMAVASAGVAAIPIPLVSTAFDIGIIVRELAFYKEQYRLDDKGLRELSQSGRASEEAINNAKKKHFWFTLSMTSVVRASIAAGIFVAGIVAEETLKYLPIIGSFVSAGLSFTSTKLFLKSSIESMEETALALHTDF